MVSQAPLVPGRKNTVKTTGAPPKTRPTCSTRAAPIPTRALLLLLFWFGTSSAFPECRYIEFSTTTTSPSPRCHGTRNHLPSRKHPFHRQNACWGLYNTQKGCLILPKPRPKGGQQGERPDSRYRVDRDCHVEARPFNSRPTSGHVHLPFMLVSRNVRSSKQTDNPPPRARGCLFWASLGHASSFSSDPRDLSTTTKGYS